jgi:hypothetical protein
LKENEKNGYEKPRKSMTENGYADEFPKGEN